LGGIERERDCERERERVGGNREGERLCVRERRDERGREILKSLKKNLKKYHVFMKDFFMLKFH